MSRMFMDGKEYKVWDHSVTHPRDLGYEKWVIWVKEVPVCLGDDECICGERE